MMDNLLLGEQVLCLSLVDCTIASLCGLLLAGYWIERSGGSLASATGAPSFRLSLHWPALILLFALCAQFWLLTGSMTGQLAPGAILRAMPSVATTHAGSVTASMLSLSVLLAATSLFRCHGAAAIAQKCVSVALLVAIFFIHAALGHAASDGDFTSAELLQFLHLVAMAVWAGGVFVSASVALPFLAEAPTRGYTTYLRRLSNSSAGAALTAILTGALKGWIALDAKLGNLAQPGWSRILLAKLFFVCVALGLGFLHRRKVHDEEHGWSTSEKRALVRTLRVEALCLACVILLSAWLSSVEPPE